MNTYLKKYYEKNKERLKIRAEERKEEIKKRSQLWRNQASNKLRIKENNLKYRKENSIELREYMRIYMQRPEVRAKYNLWIKNKRRDNPSFRLGRNMQNRIWIALKLAIGNKGSFRKRSRTKELLGCTEVDLLVYLRQKYQKGMTDENYGKWHVDHIKPVNSFNLSNIEDVKKCFHFTNLQPLWAIDNLKKSDRDPEKQG